MTWGAGALLVLALALTGCSGADEQTYDGTWRLVALEIDGSTVEPSAFPWVYLTIGEDRAGGSGPCNGFGTPVTIDGAELSFGGLVQTLQGCLGADGVVEASFFEGLTRVDRAARDGDDLELTGPAVSIELRSIPRPPVEALTGTSWALEEIRLVTLSRSPVRPATLSLDPEGVTIRSDCATLTARWSFAGSRVVLRRKDADGPRGCGNAWQRTEVGRYLGDGFFAAVEDDQLLLTVYDRTLVFTAS